MNKSKWVVVISRNQLVFIYRKPKSHIIKKTFSFSVRTRYVESPGSRSDLPSPAEQPSPEGTGLVPTKRPNELSKVQRLKRRLQHSFSKLGWWTKKKFSNTFLLQLQGRHDIQPNGTQHNDILPNDTQHCTIQHNGKVLLCWMSLCWVSLLRMSQMTLLYCVLLYWMLLCWVPFC